MNFYQISPIVNESRTHTKLTLLKLKINNWYLLSPGYEYVTLTILLIVWYFEYLYLLSLASGCVIVSDYFCWYVVILLFFVHKKISTYSPSSVCSWLYYRIYLPTY